MIDLLEMVVGVDTLSRTSHNTKFLQFRDKQWNGIRNGNLMKLLVDNSFDTLLTYDKNLQHQYSLFKPHQFNGSNGCNY